MAAPILWGDTPAADAKHPSGDEEEGRSGDLDKRHDLELRCDFPNLAVSMRREADRDTRNQEGISESGVCVATSPEKRESSRNATATFGL